MASPGRPMKYKALLLALEDEETYTPATIAMFAEDNGFLQSDPNDQRERRLEKTRIRITLGRFTNNNHFPDEGDDKITLKGQPPIPAWFGWRWKASIKR